MNGFIIVDKSSGVTSFSMVSLVRRLTGVRRVGHAGTLDPLASGVLPIAVGHATRLIEYMDDAPKMYVARVRFGVTTDTYDAEGTVTATADASALTRAEIERILPSLEGDIEQVPPVYSALKRDGKPLYRYAREGTAVAVAPRLVHVDRIEFRAFDDATAVIEVECGKGFYVRSLAHDLGQRLGVGAHLTALRRTRSGGFNLDDALSPSDIEAAASTGSLESLLLAPDRAVERRPAAILSDAHQVEVELGRDIALGDHSVASICRLYTVAGDFLGVAASVGDGVWHPRKVFPAS